MKNTTVKHEKKKEAIDYFQKEMNEHLKNANSWMGVLWAIEDGRIRMALRTTYEFPTGDYIAALTQLLNDLQSEQQKMREEMGDKKPDLLPKVDLFAKENKDVEEDQEDIQDTNIPEKYNEIILRPQNGRRMEEGGEKTPK